MVCQGCVKLSSSVAFALLCATMFINRMVIFEFLLGPVARLHSMNLSHIVQFKILILGNMPTSFYVSTSLPARMT